MQSVNSITFQRWDIGFAWLLSLHCQHFLWPQLVPDTECILSITKTTRAYLLFKETAVWLCMLNLELSGRRFIVRGHELYKFNCTFLEVRFRGIWRNMCATIQLNILYLLLIFYSAYMIYVNSSDRMTASKNVDRIWSEFIFDCFKFLFIVCWNHFDRVANVSDCSWTFDRIFEPMFSRVRSRSANRSLSAFGMCRSVNCLWFMLLLLGQIWKKRNHKLYVTIGAELIVPLCEEAGERGDLSYRNIQNQHDWHVKVFVLFAGRRLCARQNSIYVKQ